MTDKNYLGLGEVIEKHEEINIHMPSKIQADTLFNFVSKPKHLIRYLELKRIPPRYCIEEIGYLDIPQVKRIGIPMKCFCDIKLSDMEEHMKWYGYYGIAFSKEWGMNKGIQAVQYINVKSELKKEFANSFQAALEGKDSSEGSLEAKLKTFMVNELMYYKPYDGKMKNRITGDLESKCLADECEWRFVPDVTQLGYQQIYVAEEMMNSDFLNMLSDSMEAISEVGLEFEYSDIKHIIIESKEDLLELIGAIKKLDIEDQDKYELISKLIIWESVKEDF